MSIQSVKTAIAPEEEERPSRSLTYFLSITHGFASLLSVVLIALIIANGIIYQNTQDLRDQIAKNIYPQCKDLKTATEVNIALLTIVAGTSVLTWCVHACSNPKNSKPFFSILVSGLFSVAAATLFLWNVVATTYVGKLEARVCRDIPSSYPSDSMYYMTLGNVITIWCALGIPLFTGFAVWVRAQVADLKAQFQPILPMHSAPQGHRDSTFLLPQPAFRYP